MRQATPIVLLVCAFTHSAVAQWAPQDGGTNARLRGLSVVSDRVVWASGSGGTCLRTVDGGRNWITRVVPGASDLDFRDVHAVDAETAYLLSIGAGERSRIYKTSDAGTTWTVQLRNCDPTVFLDALAFWDARHGLALGDPAEGRFVILATENGGQTWAPIPVDGMPLALAGEGAFAASGTGLVVQASGAAWFGTGGAQHARVFRSTDRGRTWTAHDTPIAAGTPSAGIFSLAFRDEAHGVAIGGDYKKPEAARASFARTDDGGRTWAQARGAHPAGYRSAVAFVPGPSTTTLIAVGPTGTEIAVDGGESWKTLGKTGFDTVGFAGLNAGWAVGEEGRIARFQMQRTP